ncbi:MAG: 2-amino-4-hydroxy-6-hydroxymethyldihydropteridine diphosphokinase [Gammaproteobacteria bacterium]|nr:2-amino-4-hydroxy-6-hydroxymethyldihydropteridine diphosphokinase [Gammaproteobacteria bacterium]MDH5653971.1 2-amino-4-hydroxy-6-hydroxymethyldihydropteridine diphosphokinase [Gammaproteobacteria bacterium]
MHRVYISIGSNIEPARHVRLAVTALHEYYGELIISSVYESAAVGFDGDNFYNLVVGFDTTQSVEEVNRTLHEIEDRYGRQRSGPRFSARTIDLDLLLYDDLQLQQGKLTLPREEILQNAFVLWPLAEIAPDLIHPDTRTSMAQLWHDFDKSKQQLTPIEFAWT